MHATRWALLIAFLSGCHVSRPPVVVPPAEEPRRQTEKLLGGELVPGRISAALDPQLWSPTFATKSPSGIDRLRASTNLTELLLCFGIERVWRTFPQVEIRSGDNVRVGSYREYYERMRSEKPRRTNQREYAVPDLTGVENGFEFKFPDETDLEALAERMRAIPGVTAVRIVQRPPVQFTPNDPGWLAPGATGFDAARARGRWGMHNTGAALDPQYLDDFDLDAPEAWDITRGSQSVAVAVLDSVGDVAHPDLYLNIYLNDEEVPTTIVTAHRGASTEDGLPNELTFYDLNVPAVVTALAASGFSDRNGNGRIDGEDAVAWWSDGSDADANGFIDDLVGWNFIDGTNRPFAAVTGCYSGHGACSAGLIAAIADNAQGVAGVAHRVRILPITSVFNLAEVVYAISFPQVRVINHSQSYWFNAVNSDINALMRSLEPEGVLYVCSLGNREGFYYGADPSQREHVVSVSNFWAAGFRGTGGASGYGPKTDVAGPGHGLSSTAAGGGIESYGGTSAASPMVAGVAALIAAYRPSLTPEQIRSVMRFSASDPVAVSGDRGENTPGWDLYSGWGLVNANNALTSLAANTAIPRANIVSRPLNVRAQPRNEDLAIGVGVVPIRAILGVAGTTVNWTLRRSSQWNLGSPVVVASGTSGPLDGTTNLASIDTDPLDGRQVLELEVSTPSGIISRDRAVIDLPRAYISNLADGQFLITNPDVEGFAYGPGFTRFRIQVAPGWSPGATAFVDVASSTTPLAPAVPAEPGTQVAPGRLTTLDLATLPITLPPSGEFTLRVRTEGARVWTYDARLATDLTTPPIRAGFPMPSFYFAGVAPTAADLDGDGDRELLVTGNGAAGIVRCLNSDGSPVNGWPLTLASGEGIVNPPAIGDIDGDGRLDIVIRSSPTDVTDNIRLVGADGVEVMSGFPVSIADPLDRWPKPRSPVLADVTGDGRLDILVAVDQSASASTPLIRALQGVGGTTIRDYVVASDLEAIDAPAVGDVDGDGEIEIAAIAVRVTRPRRVDLYVWRRDGTLRWMANVSSAGGSEATESPILVDIDNDDRLEVVAGASFWGLDGVNTRLKVFDDTGTLISQTAGSDSTFQAVAAQFQPSLSPALYSILYANASRVPTRNTIVQAINPATGNSLPGWPVTIGEASWFAETTPIVADLAGTSALEVLYGNAPENITSTTVIQAALMDGSGASVTDGGNWPIRLGGPVAATPLVSDLDVNGQPELVIQTGRPDARIFVFNLSTTIHPGWNAWGEYRHDPRKTSNYHGDLRILSPTTAARQDVGPFNDVTQQGPLLVRAHFSRGAPANDTIAGNWRVRIGAVNATVREVRRVQGEHWLLIDPVTQSAPGASALRVEFNDGGIRTWDAYRDAVNYDAATVNHSTVAVIDTSGSMASDGKIDAARNAARFFAESAYPSDQVGAVEFKQAASNLLGGTGLLTAGPNRAPIANAISAISPFGVTSIGAGLAMGVNILGGTGVTGSRLGIVLLSDGLENTAPFWETPGTGGPVRPQVESFSMTHDFSIHTIALGPDANQALLQEIADVTGGTFYPVALGHSLSMLNRLADVHHFAREGIDQTERLATHGATLASSGSWTRPVSVPAGSRRLQFGLNWDHPAQLDVQIRRPNGSIVAATDPGVTLTVGPTDRVMTVWTPDSGSWTVSVTNLGSSEVETLLAVSAQTPGRIVLLWIPPLILVAPIDFTGFRPDAMVNLVLTLPNKETIEIRPHDDGKSGDGSAGDGIFGARAPLDMAGSYLATVDATLTDRDGKRFTITRARGRFNAAPGDRDADGMQDELEKRYSTCTVGFNPKSDPDGDGLTNADELHIGTHPFKADTDGDGVSDRDEARGGDDPLTPGQKKD